MKNIRFRKFLLALGGLGLPFFPTEKAFATPPEDPGKTKSDGFEDSTSRPNPLGAKISRAAEISRSDALVAANNKLAEVERELYNAKRQLASGTYNSIETYFSDLDATVKDKRGEFPGQRRGAGTHGTDIPDPRIVEFEAEKLAFDEQLGDEADLEGNRDKFPGRRQGGGGGDPGQ
jgi:hypothetical protein